MNAIEVLTTRASNGKLGEPAPDAETLALAFAAAARAPDHQGLWPLRVRVVRGAARERLGELMAELLRRTDPSADAEALAKARRGPLRAPLILVVGAKLQPHPKVPAVEQIASAGAAAHAMLLALHARGYAGILRTGPAAYDDAIKAALGFAASDAIVGFLYAGTALQPAPVHARPSATDFVQEWEPCG